MIVMPLHKHHILNLHHLMEAGHHFQRNAFIAPVLE
uniref:Uncharacterized protein n=1 Tax=Arundo donax TaxID=35708 RepID=A0A0A9JVK1_ARUDO